MTPPDNTASNYAGKLAQAGLLAADLTLMSATNGVMDRTMLAVRGALPHGQLLTPEVWARRHNGIVVLLWLQVAALTGFGLARGKGLTHALLEGSVVAVFALLAAHQAIGRRTRSAAAVVGLITASAVLVHLSGGVIETHFHFFVMIGVITLYQDWLPFGLPLGYVVVHHGLLGTLRPTDVYNHPAAWQQPWNPSGTDQSDAEPRLVTRVASTRCPPRFATCCAARLGQRPHSKQHSLLPCPSPAQPGGR